MPTLFQKYWATPAPSGRYDALDVDLILKTLYRLEKRIGERFLNSGLLSVSKELTLEGESIRHTVLQLGRPYWPLRILAFTAVGFILGVVITVISFTLNLGLEAGADGYAEWIQAIESAINELIFLSIALYFFFSLEVRFKRRIALAQLHRLRSLAHVVDMHQLTKDPSYVLADAQPTASSPERTMTAFQLKRYLDYCTELLSLISELAALYVQHLNDRIVLEAVNDLESLADGLSGKI